MHIATALDVEVVKHQRPSGRRAPEALPTILDALGCPSFDPSGGVLPFHLLLRLHAKFSVAIAIKAGLLLIQSPG